MSHSSATVTLTEDAGAYTAGHVFHAEYNGTSSVARSSVYFTHAEMKTEWRTDDRKACICDESELVKTPATYWADYGNDGCSWDTHVCLNCMVLVGYRSKFAEAIEREAANRWSWLEPDGSPSAC